MARIQQRRVRYVAIAGVLAFLRTYVLLKGIAQKPVTWPSSTAPQKVPIIPAGVFTSVAVPIESYSPSVVALRPSPLAEQFSNTKDAEPLSSVPTPSLPNLSTASDLIIATPKQCVKYEQLQRSKQEPLSTGKRKFPYSRPSPECRTFNLPSMEKLIERMNQTIKDPDLFRLFENAYPNTLDTMIKWRGYAKGIDFVTQNETITDEELTYVITGDIDAMWLRDSASQVYSYLPLLEASSDPNSLASLWRGLINLHARYIIISPYCHSFQPPPESGVPPSTNGAYRHNHPMPSYDPSLVFDCKWELDSLASFLQISTAYYQRTGDVAFFQKFNWIAAVEAAIAAAGAMRLGTYSKEGKVENSAWTFTGWTNRGSETLTNDGLGNPTKENGMVRSAFRPSDDACIYQLLVPANMMWAKYLEEASLIMARLDDERAENLTISMRNFALGIRKGIDRDAIVHHREFGDIFAYEIDGYGGQNLMDDGKLNWPHSGSLYHTLTSLEANVPSLLSIPLFNYSQSSLPLPPPTEGEKAKDYDMIYENTRNFVLSEANPYFMRGPVLSAVGGPHLGPGKGWPMAAIIRALTGLLSFKNSDVERRSELQHEVKEQLLMVLDSTAGTGVVHESVNAWSEHDWSRAWFGWANGLLGELVLKLAEQDETESASASAGEGFLAQSWQ